MAAATVDPGGAVRASATSPWLVAVLAAACAVVDYAPCPLDLEGGLPADAFERCRGLLLAEYETLEVSDRDRFLLQTTWLPVRDPPGQRRVSVFRDPEHANALLIVVELRRITIPLVGYPHWTEPRGDGAAERELRDLLRSSLEASTAEG